VALRMAILAQVHVADMNYFNSVKQFRRADELYQIDERLSAQIAKRQESDIQSMLERISQETAAIESVMRRYQTYSEVVASVGRLHSTLGMGILKAKIHSNGLKDLTRYVGKALEARMNGSSLVAASKFFNNNAELELFKKKQIAASATNVVFEKNKKDETLADYVLNLFGDVDTPEVEEIKKKKIDGPSKKVSKIKSAEMSLNTDLAGGRLIKFIVLCGTTATVQTKDGWVRITAQASNKKKVEGWVHLIYLNKFKMQCKKATQISLL